jgi:hypothetical protein
MLLTITEPVLVGLDFSFSVPAWFAHEHASVDGPAVWEHAADRGETWLRPTPPFWRERCTLPREKQFRACETRLRNTGSQPKSVFQLVGNGQVGAGSVRGMPLLAALRASGYAVWPFDPAGPRTIFEIYPALMFKRAPWLHDAIGSWSSSHERDAKGAALVMWHRRDELLRLPMTRDPVVRVEGDVWDPGATQPTRDA